MVDMMMMMVMIILIQCFDSDTVGGWQEGHWTLKNLCLKTPCDVLIAVSASGHGAVQSTLQVQRVSACPMRMCRIKMTGERE